MAFDFKKLFRYERNLSEKERRVRMVIGAILAIFSAFPASIPLLLFAIALMVTAYFYWCPIYSVLRKSSGRELEAPS